MLKKLGVSVVYRNERLETVYEKSCPLKEYTDLLRADLLRLIGDVEDAIYSATGCRQKDEWPDETWARFCKIKHKLLDKAGDVSRLADNLFE